MKKNFLAFLTIFIFLICKAQEKPKNWYLVDGIDYKELSKDEQILLDSVLNLYHHTTNDSLKLTYLNVLIEGLNKDKVWSKYNQVLLNICENKPEIVFKRFFSIALNNSGVLARNKGDISLAIEFYSRALKLREDLKDKYGIAETLHNIGLLYKNGKDYNNSLNYFLKALAVEKEIEDKTLITSTLNNLGSICLEQHKLKEALEFSNKSLEIAIQAKNKRFMSFSYKRLGDIYTALNEREKAIRFYNEGLKLTLETGDKEHLAYVNGGLSNLYLIEKKYRISEKYAISVRNIGFELGFPRIIREGAELLFKIYKCENRFKDALVMQEEYLKMRDSINNMMQVQLLANIEFNAKESKLNAEAEAQKVIANEEKKQQQFIIYTVAGVLLLVIVFAGLMYRRVKITQKQKQIIELQKEEVSRQKHIVEEHQKEMIDSITYAKRIQYALLASDNLLKKILPEHFVLFNPKDIVSGDFYWAAEHNNNFYLAVGDSTGHGVPGAFMSILNIGFLSEAIKEKGLVKPNEILNHIRNRIIELISNEGQKDGMDCVLIRFERKNDSFEVDYSAANNEPILIRNGNYKELEKDRMPVGMGEKTDDFKLFSVVLEKGDSLILYTDGYADQFGGEKGKKFKYKPLNELLAFIQTKPCVEQMSILSSTFDKWKGDLEQVDDVTIIGIKV